MATGVSATTGGMPYDGSAQQGVSGGAPTTWAQMMQYYQPQAIQGDGGGGGMMGTGTQQPTLVNIPGIGQVQFGQDGQGQPYAQRSNSDGTTTTYASDPSGNLAQATAKPESNLQSILGTLKGIAVPAAFAAGGAMLGSALGGAGAAGAAGGAGAAAPVEDMSAAFNTGAAAGTAGSASTLGGLVDSTANLGGVAGTGGADAIGSTINGFGSSVGTGLPDLGTGAAMTPGMAGTATGIPALDSAIGNTGVNLANSAGASLPGMGSSASFPELGTVASGVGAASTLANAAGGGTGSGTGAGSGSGSGGGSGLGSLAAISALIPGLAMIGSVAAGNKGADTSNLSGIAGDLTTMAGSNKPDTSGLSADAAALTGPGSTEALLTSQANSLIPSVSTGNLPPGAQTLVNNALNDATNSIKSKYAQLGLTGSTMEAQELASANAQAQAQSFQYAQQLTNTGLSEASAATSDINSAAAIQTNIINAGLSASGLSATELGTSATIYNDILQSQVAQDTALQQALANFASASAIGIGLAASGKSDTTGSTNLISGLTSGAGSLLSGASNLFSNIGSGFSNMLSSTG